MGPASAPAIDAGFETAVRATTRADLPLAPGAPAPERLLSVFSSQLESRHLDLRARILREEGAGYYTIGSSGHEVSAWVAEATRTDDPALLHYRSGSFYCHRARMAGRDDGPTNVLLGMCAAASEPIAGGRHKVFGSRSLWIPPQTSTIASHLPKAVGLAFALRQARRIGTLGDLSDDAIVVCSFGDASANHSTAAGALNAAGWSATQGLAVPVLFVCEDNGLGISVRTPPGWIRAAHSRHPGVAYFESDGTPLDAAATAADAVAHVRRTRGPAFLHMRTVRLMGHAGSDVELAYRSAEEIRRAEATDPLVAMARMLIRAGILDADGVMERYEAARARVARDAERARAAPKLATAAEVMEPIVSLGSNGDPLPPASEAQRRAFWGERLPEDEGPLTLALALNRALGDLLAGIPQLQLFGEDVARKGGVYGVTRGLQKRAGPARVFDTLLDEQTILGLAIGAGHVGLLPIPEIQYLAYLHNAEDQLRGEAATLSFFSQGQYANPMVVRIASFGYQKGFGGHFHNDNSLAVLRDIPGLVIAAPSHPSDAAGMLRSCVNAAHEDGRVCAFLEPIALYHTRDVRVGDGAWTWAYDPAAAPVPIGHARVWSHGSDVLLVSFANGVPMCLRVAEELAKAGVSAGVIDLRWLAPLPIEDVLEAAGENARILVVDETRATGGVAEGVLAQLIDLGFSRPMARVCARDSPIPLGDAANLVLLSETDILDAAVDLASR
jgi:2-oxoisovalerate dehydrogenase E1 component